MAPGAAGPDYISYIFIAVAGAVLYWLAGRFPSRLPVWLPWDFSLSFYLAAALACAWYMRGLASTHAAERPHPWRTTAFLTGVGLIYAVLQTRFEYLSQHMFFLNRIQHVVMHHIGPLLIALGWPGATIRRGMPGWVGKILSRPGFAIALDIVQQPVVAVLLFVGLFYFWLIPPVHFRAMLDPGLYAVMNWSMVADGILFWALVLDPRPKPPARVAFYTRAALAIGVMFPQILLGAFITFATHDLYPYYDLCGRLFPSISALHDQLIGGIVIWIPPAMMSVIALLLVLNALRRHEDSIEEVDDDASALAVASARWTGR